MQVNTAVRFRCRFIFGCTDVCLLTTPRPGRPITYVNTKLKCSVHCIQTACLRLPRRFLVRSTGRRRAHFSLKHSHLCVQCGADTTNENKAYTQNGLRSDKHERPDETHILRVSCFATLALHSARTVVSRSPGSPLSPMDGGYY